MKLADLEMFDAEQAAADPAGFEASIQANREVLAKNKVALAHNMRLLTEEIDAGTPSADIAADVAELAEQMDAGTAVVSPEVSFDIASDEFDD